MHLSRRSSAIAALLAVAFPLLANPATAQDVTPTRLLVRVVAHDAKLVGSGVGGARVTVRDVASGEVLARGTHEGATGDTESIVVRPIERGTTVFDTPGAASFEAVLDLREPTRVEVVAEGPLGTPHAVQRASKTLLLVPGVDILGEGLVLELNGFTVEIADAPEGGAPGAEVPVTARVTMLCGCPTEPGGLWDSKHFDVVARVVRDGRVLAEAPLAFAGETSTYSGRIRLPAREGDAELQVLALEPEKANLGMATRPLRVDGSPAGGR